MALSMAKNLFSSYNEIESSPDVPRTDIEIIKMINSRCGGLVETKKLKNNTSAVQFVHQSVRDYLADKDKVAECEMLANPGSFSRYIALFQKPPSDTVFF